MTIDLFTIKHKKTMATDTNTNVINKHVIDLDDPFSSRTEAYNYIKKLLGVPVKKSKIPKIFFNHFVLSAADERFYPKHPSEKDKEFFKEGRITELYFECTNLLKEGKHSEAEKINDLINNQVKSFFG